VNKEEVNSISKITLNTQRDKEQEQEWFRTNIDLGPNLPEHPTPQQPNAAAKSLSGLAMDTKEIIMTLPKHERNPVVAGEQKNWPPGGQINLNPTQQLAWHRMAGLMTGVKVWFNIYDLLEESGSHPTQIEGIRELYRKRDREIAEAKRGRTQLTLRSRGRGRGNGYQPDENFNRGRGRGTGEHSPDRDREGFGTFLDRVGGPPTGRGRGAGLLDPPTGDTNFGGPMMTGRRQDGGTMVRRAEDTLAIPIPPGRVGLLVAPPLQPMDFLNPNMGTRRIEDKTKDDNIHTDLHLLTPLQRSIFIDSEQTFPGVITTWPPLNLNLNQPPIWNLGGIPFSEF
jgi:hypothetical protein